MRAHSCFVVLHSPDDLQAMHAAVKAIALDPQLTWISAHVSHATYLVPGYDPHPWVERPKECDPQNAFPYILEADANTHSEWESRWAKYSAATGDVRRALAADPRWRNPDGESFCRAANGSLRGPAALLHWVARRERPDRTGEA